MAREPIDFVLPWVDGSDPAWQRKKNVFMGAVNTDDRAQRYRDWGLLRYWFRGAEKFAPWARKIWLVCDQEPPGWLNTAHPKIRVVRHEDYLPEAYRPAFNANPIELNLHRIPGLAEQFVYFNDDMYLLAPVVEKFFFRDGLPRDSALLNPIPTTDLVKTNSYQRIITVHLNDAEYLNRDYDFRACVRKHPGKWLNLKYGSSFFRNLMLMAWPRFVGFYEPHLPQPFLKSSFEEAWKADFDILDETSRHPIRDDRDVNQYLIRHRQLAEGKFIPKKPLKDPVFDLRSRCARAAETIRSQRIPMICINDGEMDGETFRKIRKEITDAFENILPERSAFEQTEAGR